MASPLALRHLHLVSAAASLFLCQCASKAPEAKLGPVDDSYWLHEPVSGPTKVVISLDEQRVALMKNGKLIGLSPISSGREGYDTHPGVFKVTEKDEDHRSSWYGAFVDENQVIVVEDVDVRKDKAPPGTKFLGAEMRYFMRFNGPIGLHQGYLPGYPASHGCIRVPAHMAHLLYEATPHGTVVEVKQNAGLIALRPPGAPSVLTQQSGDAPITPPPPVPPVEATTPPADLAKLNTEEQTQPRLISRWMPEAKTKPVKTEAQRTLFLKEAPAPASLTNAEPKPEKPKRSWFAAAKPSSTPPKIKPEASPKAKPSPASASPAPVVAMPAPSRVAPASRRASGAAGLRPISPNVPGAPPVRMTLAPRGGTEYLPGYDR